MSDATTSCSCKTYVLRTITWLLLLVCVAAWMLNVMAETPSMTSLTYLIGLTSGGLFLLFFVAQLMG
jgi:hypothetical protein